MNELQRRLDQLPRGLRDGSWAHCAVQVAGQRVHFREQAQVAAQRRKHDLTRRLGQAAAGFLLLLAVPFLPHEPAQVTVGILASLLLLSMLHGLRPLLRGLRPIELAVVDRGRGEIALLRPDGYGLRVRLEDVGMFLMVRDEDHEVYHLGIVVTEGLFLPWLHTRLDLAARSMAFLLGFVSGRPAREVSSGLPLPPEALHAAEPIARPTPETPLF